jgi:hypothetical protein
MIEQKTLQDILRYDPETGKMFWRFRHRDMFETNQQFKTWNTRYSEKEAFTAGDGKGYRQGAIFGNVCLAHRVVWTLLHGEIPPGMQIDHINGVKSDNRASNLRLATPAQNMYNVGKRAHNTSGVKGVTWSKSAKKWQAQISVSGKTQVIGYFGDVSAAQAAYLSASSSMHGDFSHHNMQCETLPVHVEVEP